MKTRAAFTMIELIFVIVVMGIIGKFGVEFLAQAYRSFIFSSVNNSLQAKSASAVEFIATRLQYRIKDSLITRLNTGAGAVGIGSAVAGTAYTVLEWVSMDIDGYRGATTPNWSGIADLDPGQPLGLIVSPATETNTTNALISTLSYSAKGVNDAALYFIGSNSDVTTDYGWTGGALTDQTGAMHPINSTGTITQFAPAVGTFTGVDIYEYYKLAWTAYAIVYSDTDGDGSEDELRLYYDYQPWNGDTLNNARQAVLMNDVATFQFTAIGNIIKIQVCANSDLVEDYSLCKEKTIF